MFSINNLKDEKFKDTIKKNSCRLRQKSTNHITEFSDLQNHEQFPNKIIRDTKHKENENIYKENNNLVKSTLSKIYKKKSKNKNIEERQIIVNKKKIEEDDNLSLKQRIFLKLKEKRNENLNINDDDLVNNHYFSNETSLKNISANHKRVIASMELKNLMYRNKSNIDHKHILNTNNEENKNGFRNIKINFDNNMTNNKDKKNFSSNRNNTIYNIKDFKSSINNGIKNGIFSMKNKEVLIKEKSELLEFNNSNLISNDNNKFRFEKDELSENFRINKKKNNHRDNKNENKKEIIYVHKNENFFDKKMKYIARKKEEEKNKTTKEESPKKNIILNRTYAKPVKTVSNFNNNLSKNNISQIIIKTNLINYNNSLKLSGSKSKMDLVDKREYHIKNNINEKLVKNDKSIKKKMFYLATEKPNIFSRSILFKNLMINTDYNNKNNYNYNKKIHELKGNNLRNITEAQESKEEHSYNKNSSEKQKKINIPFNNNYISPTSLSTRNNKVIFTELLSSNKSYKISNKINSTPNKNESNNIEYIIQLVIEAIQLKNAIEIHSLFGILLINFNNKYIVVYKQNNFTKEIKKFFDCYKYISIFIIPLIFLFKDENIYKKNSTEAKKLFSNLIYIFIKKIGNIVFKYKKIISFLDEYKKNDIFEEYETMEECCSELIKLVFKDFKEYIPLKKITNQLLQFALKESLDKIINIINNTILYCFNHKEKNNYHLLSHLSANNNYFNKIIKSQNKDFNKIINKPSVPYIRTTMKKNFCLVLDIDETIVHTMNLPYENYFLLRPGVITFLEEISKIYEIIIFTSSPKSYADSILNKIDIENKYFSYRLYKEHVLFENGKSVKKLNMIGRDLNKIIFVDNMKCNAKYNLKNLYLIPTWIQDIHDQELFKLKNKLKYIATNSKFKDDIRKGLEI